MGTFLADLDAFLEATGTAPAAFGRLAMGDPNFVLEVRHGRRTWPKTKARARAYMAANYRRREPHERTD